jgi:4-oxalocrotonate tautomerase
MPLIHIHISEGKSAQQKHDLMLAVTHAVEASLGADRKAIRVFLHEFPVSHFMAGGISPGASQRVSVGEKARE